MIYTQRELQREIHAVQERLSNEQLFLSPAYEHKLTEMGRGVTNCQFDGKAHMFNHGDDIAYTDGKEIFINYSSHTAKSLSSRLDKHNYFLGLNLHEHGHILFTDFSLAEKVRNELKKNKIYPMPTENDYLKELLIFLTDENNNFSALQGIYHYLDNAIEDGFVDRAVSSAVPGYGECLDFVNQVDVGTFSSYKKMKSENLSSALIFANLTLGYCVYQKKGYSEEEIESDEVLKSFEDCLQWLRKAVYEVRPIERKRYVNTVFCHLFHFIKQDAEKKQQEQNQQQQDNQQTTNQQQSNQQSINQQQNNQQQSSQQQGNESNQNNSTSSNSQEISSGCSLSQAINEALNSLNKNLKNTENTKHLNPQSPNNEAMNEISNNMDSAGNDASEKKSNSQETKQSPSTQSSESSLELDQIAQDVATSMVNENQEKEISKENSCNVKKFLDGVSIHSNVHCKMTRSECSSSATSLYNDCHQELDIIVRRFIKEFEKEIKERQLGDTLTGLYAGKRLDGNHLYRTDKRLFSRKIMPEDIPDMAVGILIDCSGSMGGDRIEIARKCAYITYSFCQKMNIPCFVLGHSADRSSVRLCSVADENSLDNKDRIRIFDLHSGGNNRDGFALRYCLKKLEQIQAKDRLMLIISDGRPNHNGYGIESGMKDCQLAVHDAIKKGISTVAAGLGSDAQEVCEVYKSGRTDKDSASFLDISDIDRMPKAFIKIIKKKLEN